jgi:uncharacterized membrane-anchored protein YjiN (DUF445 family)
MRQSVVDIIHLASTIHIKEIDTICSVGKGSMDDKQLRATVEHHMRLQRLRAAKEVHRILRQEIEDANKRIDAKEINPLYWPDRRFSQLADEIEEDDYYPTAETQ